MLTVIEQSEESETMRQQTVELLATVDLIGEAFRRKTKYKSDSKYAHNQFRFSSSPYVRIYAGTVELGGVPLSSVKSFVLGYSAAQVVTEIGRSIENLNSARILTD